MLLVKHQDWKLTRTPDFYIDVMKHEQYAGKPEVSLKRKRIEDMDNDAELLLEEARVEKELGEAHTEVLEARKKLSEAHKKISEAETKAQTLQERLKTLAAKKQALADKERSEDISAAKDIEIERQRMQFFGSPTWKAWSGKH